MAEVKKAMKCKIGRRDGWISLFGLGALLWFLMSPAAHAASLYFSPASGSFLSDQNFTIHVYVGSPDESINAASGIISFPADKLQAVSISKADSIFSLWVQEPSFSNLDGSAHFEGVVLNPGFTGAGGKLFSITFKPRAVGSALFSFSAGSVLANDGSGTNILQSLGKASYTIRASGGSQSIQSPKISSVSHPDESKWYNFPQADFSWNLPEGVSGVSYALNKTPGLSAPQEDKGLVSSVSFNLNPDQEGLLYLHVRFRTEDGWGLTNERMIRTDRSPPDRPEVLRRLGDDELTNPQPEFSIRATDLISDISHYEIKIDESGWVRPATSSDGFFLVPIQPPGEHAMEVRAYDLAGNFSSSMTSFVIQAISSPVIVSYSKHVNYLQNPLSVEGTGLPNTRVKLQIKKSGEVIEFWADADERGDWSARYSERIPQGVWKLVAFSSDARGALSNPSNEVTVEAGSPQSFFLRMLAYWGGLGALVILVVGGIFTLLHFTLHRVHAYRIRLRGELLKVKNRLRKDLRDLEKEISEFSGKDGEKIDLRPSQLKEEKNRLLKEIERVEADINEEIRTIDKI